MQYPLIASVVSALLLNPVLAEQPGHTLPLHLNDKGHAYVFVSLNGVQNQPMIIDSAAQQGVLPLSLLAPLALNADQLETTSVTSATGTTELAEGIIESTVVAGASQAQLEYIFTDMTGLSLPDGREPGLLGHDFLRNYCVDMHFAVATLTLTPGQCDAKSLAGLSVLDIDTSSSFIRTQASFSGVLADVLFDTGAHHSFVNGALTAKLNGLTVTGEEQTMGLAGKPQPRKVIQGLSYQLGSTQVTEPKSYAADLHVFEQLGYKDTPFMLLGLRPFREGRLVIDYAANKLYFRQ